MNIQQMQDEYVSALAGRIRIGNAIARQPKPGVLPLFEAYSEAREAERQAAKRLNQAITACLEELNEAA